MSAGRVLIWTGDAAFAAAVGVELRRRRFEPVRASGLLSLLPEPHLMVADVDSLPPMWRKIIMPLRKRYGSLAVIIVSSTLAGFARLQSWRPRGYVRKPFRMDIQAPRRQTLDPKEAA